MFLYLSLHLVHWLNIYAHFFRTTIINAANHPVIAAAKIALPVIHAQGARVS
jgi:hypothetical protein